MRDYRWMNTERRRSLVLRDGNPKQSDISIAKYGMGTKEVPQSENPRKNYQIEKLIFFGIGEAHSTA